MFCVKCGKELSEGANFCPNCGAAVQGVAESSSTNDSEIVIKEGVCNRIKSKLFVQNGHGMLTNKRFIYSKHSFAKMFAIGALVNLTKGSYEFDIPVSDITGLRDGRQGVSKTIVLSTKSGQDYEFYFTDRERWIIEFNNLIQ